MVVPGLESLVFVALEVLGVPRESFPDLGENQFSVGAGEDRHDGREGDRPAGDPPARDPGGEEGGQFVVALEPRQGEHGAGQGNDGACGIEERDQPVAVVLPEHLPQSAPVGRVRDELLHVGEGVDNERQPCQTDKHDHEGVELGAGDVAIDQHAGP